MVLHSEKNFSPVFGPSSGSMYACISLYLHSVNSPVFGPSSGAERLNAKNIWDEDHDAILEEIAGTGEKVLIMMRKHHLVMHLGMDHHHHHQKRMATIKCRIVSSHRN
jgi:hypothetical protein